MVVLTEEHVGNCAYDFPVGFGSTRSNGWLFVAYYDAEHHLTVSARKPNDATWHHQTLPSQANWDSHRAIELAVDKTGCLHVSGNMHADPLVYFKTSEPLDIATFERLEPMVRAEDEERATYRRILKGAKGDLYFMDRHGGSGNGITIVNRCDADTGAFERVSDKPLFDGLNEMSAYLSGPSLGPDGRYHLTWVWRNTPHCETNHDLSYAVSDDLLRWSPRAGTSLGLPITPQTDPFTVDPVPSEGDIINGGHTMVFDTDNSPILIYHKYDEAGISQVHIARHDGTDWTIHCVSDWNHRWAFTGPGSITNEIQLGRPRIERATLAIPYWHIKRGNGLLNVDLKSNTRISDQPIDGRSKPYPAELGEPRTDGLTVRWLPVDDSSDVRSAFRWELGGKRRFYDPPDPAIPPGPLMFYQFSD